jgi:lipopolysaccharide transport system ATP-binding protein
LSSGYAQQGERVWRDDEIVVKDDVFRPRALRLRNPQGKVVDTIRSTEGCSIEFEYDLLQAVTGLRVGLYFQSTRGEFIFTTFDTDQPDQFEKHTARKAGHYVSRCSLPEDLFNEGRFSIGVNASSYRIKRYFQDEQALVFTVDAAGAPGMQWPEVRLGPIRPRLEWQIEELR